ncbi:MAG TPA: helix-turn-helix domain-containing protein [Steroidobacteraceae bacterium]|nr:helix-turn-helix domain-containing protein [Steroidobacteraceae bacterium]
MHRVETFSTAGQTRADRLAYWNDVAVSTIGPLVIDALDRDSFHATLKRVRLRNCELVAPTSNPATIRTQPTGAISSILNLQVQHRGRSSTRFGERICTLDAGDFMLFDPSCASVVEFSETTQAIVVRLPTAEAEGRIPGLREMAGVPVRGSTGAPAMLSRFIRAAWTQLECEDDLGWAQSLCEVIWPLVEMAYAGISSSRATHTPREHRQREVFAYIDSHFLEANLTARRIAHEFSISTRYVQIMFAEAGTTPSSYIQSRRLDHAAQLLAQTRRDTSITAVAFDSGFNDLSTFSRVFRRKFGVAPREYRAGARPRAA